MGYRIVGSWKVSQQSCPSASAGDVKHVKAITELNWNEEGNQKDLLSLIHYMTPIDIKHKV